MKLENLPTEKFLEMDFENACSFILQIRERRRAGKIKKPTTTQFEKNTTKLLAPLSQSDKERLLTLLKGASNVS